MSARTKTFLPPKKRALPQVVSTDETNGNNSKDTSNGTGNTTASAKKCANVCCQKPLDEKSWLEGWKESPESGTRVPLCKECGVLFLWGNYCPYCYQVYKDLSDEFAGPNWIGCDSCSKWVHVACERKNTGEVDFNSEYYCPECIQKSKQDPMDVDEKKTECKLCSKMTNELGIIECCSHTFCFECIVTHSCADRTCPECSLNFTRITRAQASSTNEKKLSYTIFLTNSGNGIKKIIIGNQVPKKSSPAAPKKSSPVTTKKSSPATTKKSSPASTKKSSPATTKKSSPTPNKASKQQTKSLPTQPTKRADKKKQVYSSNIIYTKTPSKKVRNSANDPDSVKDHNIIEKEEDKDEIAASEILESLATTMTNGHFPPKFGAPETNTQVANLPQSDSKQPSPTKLIEEKNTLLSKPVTESSKEDPKDASPPILEPDSVEQTNETSDIINNKDLSLPLDLTLIKEYPVPLIKTRPQRKRKRTQSFGDRVATTTRRYKRRRSNNKPSPSSEVLSDVKIHESKPKSLEIEKQDKPNDKKQIDTKQKGTIQSDNKQKPTKQKGTIQTDNKQKDNKQVHKDNKQKDIKHTDVLDFRPGDLVWVKYADYPFWPAQVISLNSRGIPKDVVTKKKKDSHLVRFFGDEETYAWIKKDPTKIKAFREHFHSLENNKSPKWRRSHKIAVEDALHEESYPSLSDDDESLPNNVQLPRVGDVVAVRPSSDSEDKFWLAEVLSSAKRGNTPKKKKKNFEIKVQWFEFVPNTKKTNCFHLYQGEKDTIPLGSIFLSNVLVEQVSCNVWTLEKKTWEDLNRVL